MKSIRKKITVCLMATVLTALAAVGASSILLNYRSTIATVDDEEHVLNPVGHGGSDDE